jgi:hypothetical protein
MTAPSARFRDLERVAGRLGDLVDAERPDAVLPFVALARATVIADHAASELKGLLAILAGTAPAPSPERAGKRGQ